MTHGGAREGAGRTAGYRKPGAKNETIALRVQPGTRKLLAAAAAANDESVSEWVWGAILARFAREALDGKPTPI